MAEIDRLRLLAQARQRRAGASAPQQQSNDLNVIATTPDGGRIYEQSNGTRGFTSEGYSTTDPAKVEQLMSGATPVELVQTDIDSQRIAQNPIAARANEVVRGTPFVGSYADEAVGAFSQGAADNMRKSNAAMQRQHPTQTAALNIAGGVAGSIPMAIAAGPAIAANAPTSIGAQALAGLGLGAGAGAVEGGIYAAGEGQGSERGKNATQGALIGGLAGGVLGAAAPYAAAGVRSLVKRLKGSEVRVIARELGISEAAAGQIRNTLDSQGVDAAVEILQRGGDDAMLADAGRPMAQLLDASAATGGGASRIAADAVGDRTRQAAGRMTEALDAALGAPAGQSEIIDGIRAGSKPARSAAYDAAYSQPIDYAAPAGRRIESILNNRIPAGAIKKAQDIMNLREEASSQIMARIGDNGRVTFETMPDVKQVHYIMQALDDMASSTDGSGVFGRQNTFGSSVEGVRRDLSNALKASVPDFAAAQNIAADTAREINMTETGYNMFRAGTRRDEVMRSMNGATTAERNAAKQGLRSYLDDVTANVTRTITNPDASTNEGIKVLRDFSSRANQGKLRTMMGEEAANSLMSEIDEAATAFELRAAIADNSKTAIRSGLQQSGREAASGGVLNTISRGEPVNAGKRLIQAITGETDEAQQLRSMGLFEDIARALTEKRGGQARQSLQIIQQAMNGQQITDAQARLIATTIVGSSALSASRGASIVLQ